jgi:hypothetical protein
MKKIILISFFSFFLSSISYSQSKLPKCIGDDQNKYNNCYGKVELPFLGDTKLVYEGEFKNGAFHGFGVLTSPSSKYIGEYNNGRRNGNGTLFLWDQSKYVGEFKDDKKEGKGTLIKQDGSTYVGEFKNDRINGQGTYTSPDGKKSSGLFQNGKLVK